LIGDLLAEVMEVTIEHRALVKCESLDDQSDAIDDSGHDGGEQAEHRADAPAYAAGGQDSGASAIERDCDHASGDDPKGLKTEQRREKPGRKCDQSSGKNRIPPRDDVGVSRRESLRGRRVRGLPCFFYRFITKLGRPTVRAEGIGLIQRCSAAVAGLLHTLTLTHDQTGRPARGRNEYMLRTFVGRRVTLTLA